MVDAAALERCCQKLLSSDRTEATKRTARLTWDTARDGKGLTSLSDPSESSSSCQWGKVASRRMVKNAKATLTNLSIPVVSDYTLMCRQRKESIQQCDENNLAAKPGGGVDEAQRISELVA